MLNNVNIKKTATFIYLSMYYLYIKCLLHSLTLTIQFQSVTVILQIIKIHPDNLKFTYLDIHRCDKFILLIILCFRFTRRQKLIEFIYIRYGKQKFSVQLLFKQLLQGVVSRFSRRQNATNTETIPFNDRSQQHCKPK